MENEEIKEIERYIPDFREFYEVDENGNRVNDAKHIVISIG